MNKRENIILNLLAGRGRMEVSALAQALGVSPVTVRKDLDELERRGVLRREHGFAVFGGSDDMNNLLGQLRKSVVPDDYQNAMSLIQDQFEQDIPYLCLYWRSGALLSRSAFTDARDIRELELLRGVESFGSK